MSSAFYNSAALSGGAGPYKIIPSSRLPPEGPTYNYAGLLGGGKDDLAYEAAALMDGAYVPTRTVPKNVTRRNPAYSSAFLLDNMKREYPESYDSAALMGGARLKKGSLEAKARMAYLRSLRGKSKYTSKKTLHRTFMKRMRKLHHLKPGTKRWMAYIRALRGAGGFDVCC